MSCWMPDDRLPRQWSELFADLPPGHEFFERYAFISHEDLPVYQALLARLGREGVDALRDDERDDALVVALPPVTGASSA